MKNQILLSLLAAGVLLAGCSKSENEGGEGPVPGQPVAIRLSSGIGDASKAGTKAPVTAEDPATVQIEGWESSTGAADYTAATSTWQSTASVKVLTPEEIEADETANDITLSPVQFYNADENIKTYIKGWYPAAKSAAGKVTFSAAEDADKGYDYAGDGTDDVLLSNEVSGGKKEAEQISEALVFDHVTTQLVFKVKKGEGLAAGTKIKTIKLKGGKIPGGIDLSSGTVTFTAPTEDDGKLDTKAEVAEITTEATQAGVALMVEETSDNDALTLFIETTTDDGTTVAATYDNVKIKPSTGTGFKKGTAYSIEMTFKQNGIVLEANITPWTEATGEGEVI